MYSQPSILSNDRFSIIKAMMWSIFSRPDAISLYLVQEVNIAF